MPHKRPFVSALALTSLHYLSLVGIATSVVLLSMRQDALAAWLVAGAVAAAGITWLTALLKRRSARCPLCKGTPFLNSGALTHRKASRVFPFNHGTTAVIAGLFTQRFSCMYCGTRYDLLKQPSNRRDRAD